MTTTFLESGSDATRGFEFWTSIVGSPASVTTPVYTGPRAIDIPAYASCQKNSVLQDSGTRLSCRVRFTDVTTTLRSEFLRLGLQWFLFINTAGLLQVVDGGTGTLTDTTHTFALNTYYRLAVAYTITSGSVNELRVFVDGVQVLSISNIASAQLGGANLTYFGLGDNGPAGSHVYLDDVFVDDSSSLTDPGDIRVTSKLPASNNVNQFTTAIGANPANRWENVNERPLSETNGWLDAVNSNRENYGIESLSAGDVNLTGATLVSRCAWIWAKGAVGGLGSPKITNNGTDTAIVLTSAGKLFTNIVDSASYPSAADTIGMVSAGVADATSFYECGMLVAYIPSSAGPTVGQQMAAIEQLVSTGGLTGRRYV